MTRPDGDDADVGPLLKRARELLVEARDQVDADRESLADDQLWEYIQGAAARTESAQILVDGPEVLEDSE
jgi:flagellin-like hook-associated protein FlgL